MGIKSFINKIKRKVFGKNEDVAFFTKDHFKHEEFIIGDYTYGKPIVYFKNKTSNLIIGKFCSISENVKIFLGGNHRTDWITTYPFNDIPKYFPELNHIKGHPSTKGDVTIGNDVWIGYGATIMSGVSIANGAVVGAQSVVTKNIGAYEIWAGNPAKFIKKRFDETTVEKLEQLKWWDLSIEKIKQHTDLLCTNHRQLEHLIDAMLKE